MKRVTLEQSLSPQIQALDKTMFIDGFVRIIGTGREKTAVLAE